MANQVNVLFSWIMLIFMIRLKEINHFYPKNELFWLGFQI
jgi:hypothetical protein